MAERPGNRSPRVAAFFRGESARERYFRDVRIFRRQHPGMSWNEAQASPQLREARRELADIASRERQGLADTVDYSPRGPFARALVELGYRAPDSPYNVGDTPRKGRRR